MPILRLAGRLHTVVARLTLRQAARQHVLAFQARLSAVLPWHERPFKISVARMAGPPSHNWRRDAGNTFVRNRSLACGSRCHPSPDSPLVRLPVRSGPRSEILV